MSALSQALTQLRNGGMVILVDDEDRENEGDLIFAAEDATNEKIAFMMNKARGLICIAMDHNRIDALELPLMVPNNTESMKTAFTVSVDYIPGTTTGISAADRAATVKALVDPNARPAEFARPGHIFPLRANPDGVLGRTGHTEAAVDLCRLAGKLPAGVICEISNDDGTMARLPQLEIFAEQNGLLVITIEDLVRYLTDAKAGALAAA
jgi:3,4-dihydroxy 2-butanone 4-phosphate synthase